MIQRQIYAQVATDTISLNIHKHRSINPENFVPSSVFLQCYVLQTMQK